MNATEDNLSQEQNPSSLHPACSVSDHQLNHDFLEWLRDQIGLRPAVAWRGTALNRETFVSWDEYTRVYFREWALSLGVDESRWQAVLREYMND